ncbi:MAG: RimK-like ATPgrasp N-terminal domain-containing protein [Halobacteria archaeon]
MIISEYPLDGLPYISPDDFLANKYPVKKGELIINLSSDLRFLKSGYYVSLLANRVIPSIEDLSDLYCPPSLFKRLESKLSIVKPKILDEAPRGKGKVIIYPVNQLNKKRYFIAHNNFEKQICYEEASLHHRYPVAVLPLESKLEEFAVILGNCVNKKYAHIAKLIYSEFRIPVFKLLMQGRRFSGMLPCSLKQLNSEEFNLLIQSLREI